jgi:hypothetical protein
MTKRSQYCKLTTPSAALVFERLFFGALGFSMKKSTTYKFGHHYGDSQSPALFIPFFRNFIDKIDPVC